MAGPGPIVGMLTVTLGDGGGFAETFVCGMFLYLSSVYVYNESVVV